MKFDTAQLENALQAVEHFFDYRNQLCITGTSPSADCYEGAGSLTRYLDDNTNQWIDLETPGREEDFIHLIDMFKDTYFEHVFDTLSRHYKLGRCRIMRMMPRACYSWHTDSLARVHIALRSNPQECGLIHGNTLIRVPNDGTVTEIDTTQFHTAFNASINPRMHLVCCILEKY